MSDTCPYCPPATAWGMHPEGLERLRIWHDAGHPVKPKSSTLSPDTSASANASPVVNKHSSPTPTIEELDMIDYIVTMRTLPEQGTDKIFAEMRLRLTKKSKAELALLITKAEQNARLDELTYVHIRDGMLYTSAPDDGADHTINDRIAQLKELTQ